MEIIFLVERRFCQAVNKVPDCNFSVHQAHLKGGATLVFSGRQVPVDLPVGGNDRALECFTAVWVILVESHRKGTFAVKPWANTKSHLGTSVALKFSD